MIGLGSIQGMIAVNLLQDWYRDFLFLQNVTILTKSIMILQSGSEPVATTFRSKRVREGKYWYTMQSAYL